MPLNNDMGRPFELPEVMQELNNALGKTEELMATARTRLSPVLRPSAPDVCANPKPERFGSPLAAAIFEQVMRLYRINDELQGLLDRTEI